MPDYFDIIKSIWTLVYDAIEIISIYNEDNIEYIKGQILETQEIALKKGAVIAIGHGHININILPVYSGRCCSFP